MGEEPTFQEPDVLLPVHEAEIRREFAIKIESRIRTNQRTANFKLSAAQVATILFVPLSALRPGGYLWIGVPSGELHQRLTGLPALVKHFLQQPPPWKRPEHPEERECSERNGNVCAIIGTSNPWVGHIVPFAWNDTLANIQKTEKVYQHIQAFFGIDWLLRYRPYLLNPQQPGSSDKVWNMICLNVAAYGWWRCAEFGFKCLDIRQTTQGESVVILQFNWVPQQEMDPKKVMSLQGQDNDFDKMVEYAKAFHRDVNSDFVHELPGSRIPSRRSILSGHLMHIPMPNHEAVLFKAMVDLQWAMLVVAAFCGGAVTPRLLPDLE